MDNRQFKGIWVPADIYLSKEIGWHGKLIFLEIDSFTSREMDCFFSNEYLAEFFDISIPSVSRYINRLIEIGWVEQTCFDGRKRHLRSCRDKAALSKVIRQSTQKRSGRLRTFDNHNNKSIILPINKEEIHIEKSSFKNDNNTPLNTVLENTNTELSPAEKTFFSFKAWIVKNAPSVAQMVEPFTLEQFNTLMEWRREERFGCSYSEIYLTLIDMHNYKPLLEKSKSAFYTFKRWTDKKQKQTA